jgi:hypothetical protein
MIEFIIQCLAVSLSIAIGIVFVYGCCKAINRLFDGRAVSCGKIKVKNFVADGKPVDVKLSDGHVLMDQRFVGFADFGTQKEVPYEFKTWLVLESGSGRSFIKPQTVRSITEKNNDA